MYTRDRPLTTWPTPHSRISPLKQPASNSSPLYCAPIHPQKTPIMEDEKSKSKKKGAAHRKSLSCEYCSRSFARLEHLQRHLRTR